MEHTSIAGTIAAALSENLSEEERAELDEIVTPRAATLFVKAFGPEMAALLSPFTEDDANVDGLSAETDVRQGEEELRALMRDPRYWREKDRALVARVEKGFKALFPEAGPAQ
ncbi:MAG: hypothetical protein JKY20_08085 [Alphaproteobacteria bacterium]|nr:hypothetical protein [Alphaproteobacteria bacterium]